MEKCGSHDLRRPRAPVKTTFRFYNPVQKAFPKTGSKTSSRTGFWEITEN